MSRWSRISQHIISAKARIASSRTTTKESSSPDEPQPGPGPGPGPSLPLELWVKIIRYIADSESCDPVTDMLHLWLHMRAVSHHVRDAVDLIFQDIYLKQVFIGQINSTWPSKKSVAEILSYPYSPIADRTVQITWFPYDRLAVAPLKEEEGEGKWGYNGNRNGEERVVFASNDFWGGRFGSAAPSSSSYHHQDKLKKLLAVWLPPDQKELIRIADIDVKYNQREVAVYWRDVFGAFVPMMARRRAREAKPPQPRPRSRFRTATTICRRSVF